LRFKHLNKRLANGSAKSKMQKFKSILYYIALLAVILELQSCAIVPQKDREYLSDPIMQLNDNPGESRSDSHSMPRREGSTGGGGGVGGGCGC
jgi:hypothetical protein